MAVKNRKVLKGHGGAAGEVRIIGGCWKRTPLPVADAPGLRPTPSRIRETLFNWLGQDLTGWRCMDAFAGSGALGFEAASRGAAEVVMVEKDRHLVKHLQHVKAKLEADNVQLVCADAFAVFKQYGGNSLDVVFLDPSFAADVFEQALHEAARVVAPGGAVYLEADRAIEPLKGLSSYRQAKAGAVYYHLFVKDAPVEGGFI